MENKEVKTNLKKNKEGYGYKYTELAEIHRYLEENNSSYYQYIERIDNDDYIVTVKIIDGKEQSPLRGCRVVNANLSGIKNPAQEQGSALTYARRYSLLMAFGLATEDDDAQVLSIIKDEPKATSKQIEILRKNYTGENLRKLLDTNNILNLEDISIKKASELIEKLYNKGGK